MQQLPLDRRCRRLLHVRKAQIIRAYVRDFEGDVPASMPRKVKGTVLLALLLLLGRRRVASFCSAIGSVAVVLCGITIAAAVAAQEQLDE